MARSRGNIILNDLHGVIGNQVVVKQYAGKTVVTKYPDMSGIIPSEGQKMKRNTFKEAVAYAQSILKDPQQKADFQSKLKKGETVYHAAIKAYLKQVKNSPGL